MLRFKPCGVDPLFPKCGEVVTANGFYLDDAHGGTAVRAWIDKNFQAKEDDIYVVSFPKTGTTWTQELVYIINNDLNFEKAREKPLHQRFPYLELKQTIETNALANLAIPRYIKSHYPYSILPKSILDKKCKMVYTIRNPKDTLVSYYYFALGNTNSNYDYQGDFPTFFKLFIQEERIPYGPFSKHILEFWERRNDDNILVLQYEQMKNDTSHAVRNIAEFFGKTLTKEQVQQVVKHCSFENMGKNPSTNYVGVIHGFMRKGIIGDWKNHFSHEMNLKMDDYINRHFAGTGLNFQCD